MLDSSRTNRRNRIDNHQYGGNGCVVALLSCGCELLQDDEEVVGMSHSDSIRAVEREDEQLAGISDAIVAMANLDFEPSAPVVGNGGVLDGVAVGLNLLAEELNFRVRDNQRVDRVLNALRDAVVVVSDDGTFRYLNRAARVLLDVSDQGEVPGRLHDHLVLPASAQEKGEQVLPLSSSTGPVGQPPITTRRFLRRDRGPRQPVLVSVEAIQARTASGDDAYVCVLFTRDSQDAADRWLAGSTEGKVPFSVRSLVSELVEFHQGPAEALGLTIEAADNVGVPEWVVGARSPLQGVLHALIDAALQWTRSGKIVLAVNAVTAVATGRTVLRFSIAEVDGEVDDSLRRSIFASDTESSDVDGFDQGLSSLSIQAACIVAESLGGRLGLHRGVRDQFVARLWVEMALFERGL